MRAHERAGAWRWRLLLVAVVLTSVTGCDLLALLWGGSTEGCEEYCAKMAACQFDDQESCEQTCAENGGPEFEDCVMTLDCAAASRCILCRQYCDKLSTCGVSTDAACESSCDTNLASGADSGKYQCVVDSPCTDISNCGI
ncbi:MAG: hypothetical protein JXR83_11450 [Deltaproteobacteria bacterium]|nr:hypothetical protein [Deltaproteobacteria bacterium]